MRIKIIDGHFHTGFMPEQFVPDKSLETTLALMDKLDIERAVSANSYMFLDGQFERALAQDAVVYEKSNHRIYTYFGFHPRYTEQALAAIQAHKNDPQCVAIKIHPNGARVFADDEAYRPIWETAKALGLPIMSHTWDTSTYNPGQKYAFTGLFEKYIREYPEVTFIFGHCGGRYNGIKTAIEIGKRYANANFDITGDIWLNGFIEALVEGVGADRIVYGSDHTMIEQRPMLGVVYGSNIPTIDKEKILYHTAERIYFSK